VSSSDSPAQARRVARQRCGQRRLVCVLADRSLDVDRGESSDERSVVIGDR
jgi:hypothetical protein